MTYTIDLAGKVAVVTGGSGVLGSAMCQALAQAGAVAVVIGTSIEKAQSTVDTIVEQGGKALPLAADVLDKNILQDACDTIMIRIYRRCFPTTTCVVVKLSACHLSWMLWMLFSCRLLCS